MGDHQTLTNHPGVVSVHALQLGNQPGESIAWGNSVSQESNPCGWVTCQGVGGQAETGNSHAITAQLLWSGLG